MKNKIGTALVSLLIAFGIWMYVVSVVAPESEREFFDIPVKLHGEDVLQSRDLMLVSDQDMRLDITLSGTRTDLSKLTSANIIVYADLSGITSAGTHMVHYTVSNLGAISVVEPQTQAITVTVVEYAEKEVPITVEYLGEVPQGYVADMKNITMDRKSVVISGSREEVEKVETVSVTVDLTDRTENVDGVFDLNFLDSNGRPVEFVNATVDAQTVTMVLKVNMIKTVEIVPEFIPGEDLTENDIAYTMQFNTLELCGPAHILEQIEAVTVKIDLNQWSESVNDFFVIDIPEGTFSKDGITEVLIQLDVPPLITEYNRLVGQWMYDLPENLEIVRFSRSQLSIVIRGRAHRMEMLLDEHIFLYVDLTNAQAGEHEYLVEVRIIGVDGIEVLNADAYTVVITLEEKDLSDSREE